MKHKMLMIAALCTALAATLAQPARCEWHWQTTQITSGHTWFTGGVKAWNDQIYWNDRRSGKSEIYVWDPAGGERLVITGSESTSIAGVYGNQMVVAKYVNSQYDLYLWDPANGMRPVSPAPVSHLSADIFGESVVFESYQSGISQIWMWDPVAGARAVSPSGYAQQLPRIYGNSVVWQESRTFGRTDVFMWSPGEGERQLSTYIYGMDHPDIYGDTVVMSLHWQAGMYDPVGIWQWKAGQGLVGPLVENREAYYNRVSGDLIAWGVGPGEPAGAVMAYHPTTGVVRLFQNGRSQDVYGNKVVWVSDTYDIWMAELVPEPSSLISVVSGCIALAWILRRRRTE